MKLQDLFESPQQDAQFRARAKSRYKEALAEIKANGLDSFQYVSHLRAFVKKFSNFQLAITKGQLGNGGYSMGSDTIWVYIKDFNNPYKDFSRSEVEIAFIHESIHSLDKQRMKVMPQAPAPRERVAAYMNHATETNAFYQEALAKVDNIIRTAGKQILSRNWSTFEAFHRSVTSRTAGIFDAEFLDNLSDSNKKNLTRRLYKHWEMIRDDHK